MRALIYALSSRSRLVLAWTLMALAVIVLAVPPLLMAGHQMARQADIRLGLGQIHAVQARQADIQAELDRIRIETGLSRTQLRARLDGPASREAFEGRVSGLEAAFREAGLQFSEPVQVVWREGADGRVTGIAEFSLNGSGTDFLTVLAPYRDAQDRVTNFRLFATDTFPARGLMRGFFVLETHLFRQGDAPSETAGEGAP